MRSTNQQSSKSGDQDTMVFKYVMVMQRFFMSSLLSIANRESCLRQCSTPRFD